MDHLPIPSGSTYPRFEIVYETSAMQHGTMHHGAPFLDFPARSGWDLQRLMWGDFSERPLEETSAMLRNWLFFGLLWEFFDGNLELHEFVRRENDCQFLTTEMLLLRLREWKSIQRTRSQSARESWLKRIETCLDKANIVVRLLGTTPYVVSHEALLSFIVLGISLSFVRRWIILPGDPDCFSLGDGAPVSSWGTSFILVKRLFESGWCPTDMARLHSMFDVLGMHQASFLRQPRGAVLHTSCSRTFCIEDNIEQRHYGKIYHECNFSSTEGPDLQKITNILESGGFPLIRLRSSMGSPLIQDVVSYRPGLSYTAISHVWSHGLGNPSANALPTSRLKELQGYLSALEAKTEPKSVDGTQDCEGSDLYLWIDTLCVPLDTRIRKIALLRINAAYANSRFVLVLDTSLKYISCKTIKAELALRVYSSRWMQRLWTLAEGVLAQRLCFQFLDGSVTLDDLKPPLQLSWDQIFVSQLHCQAFRPLMVFRRIRILPPSERFDILWNASTYRSTSKKHDEPIILGIIAGFGDIHMSRIVHAPDLKRMEVFFSCWDSLPARIIFTAGQHLTTNGYGWAVESLLNKGDLVAYDHPKSDGRDDLTACRVPEGLVVCAAGYLLKENVYQLPEEFQVMNEDNTQTISVE